MKGLEYAAVTLVSYLIGAIPCGLIAGKISGVDIREYGSGSTGATNVLRTVGLGASAVVLACDFSKGAIMVLFARFLLHSNVAEVIAALVAIVGHNWPVYSKFQGGRGVSTGFGALLVLSPLATLVSAVIGLTTIGVSRYVSLGSMIGALTALLAMSSLVILGREPFPYLFYPLVGTPLILFRHRDNMRRIWAGTENKLGQRAERRAHPSPGDETR